MRYVSLLKAWKVSFTITALALCFAAPSVRAQQAQTPAPQTSATDTLALQPVQTATSQAEIMARVIEDSLDDSGLDDWRGQRVGLSPFNPTIRAQYVPTVGAIFTVQVGFLINEPSAQDTLAIKPEAAAAEVDLWQVHASENRGLGAGMAGSFGGGRGGGQMGGGMGGAAGGAMWSGAEAPTEKMEDHFVEVDGDKGIVRGRRGSVGPAPSFEKGKVETFRKTIVQTLAKYGHRMDKIGENERLIVIVEAPPVVNRFQEAETPEMRGGGGMMGGAAPLFGGLGASPKATNSAPTDASATQTGQAANKTESTALPWLRIVISDRTEAHDCWMLALPKSSLGSSVGYDAVSGQVEEHRF